jgi:predicted DCC family thiol-disulfide oxidoreductase YuxK
VRIQDKYDIVLFDGVCNLCNGAVDFIIRNDKKNNFKFGSLQDAFSKKIMQDYAVAHDYLDSIVLIRGDRIFFKSEAALEICKKLGGIWTLFYCFKIFPDFMLNPVYDWIANSRYKWFGKRHTCRLPSPGEKSKFLSDE